MRYLILVLSSLFFINHSHAQFNSGNLKEFNLQLNVALLNYQIKVEYAPAPRHLLSLGVGYGSIMYGSYLAYSYAGKDMNTEEFYDYYDYLFILPSHYFSFTSTLNYKYYPLKSKDSQAEKHNQGFYLFTKLRFIGSENKLRFDVAKEDQRAKYILKPGIGYGFNIKFNKQGTVGLDIHQGIGFVVNPYFNYTEIWPMMKTSVYFMFNQK